MLKYQQILFHIVKKTVQISCLIKYGNKHSAYECMYNQGVPSMKVTS